MYMTKDIGENGLRLEDDLRFRMIFNDGNVLPLADFFLCVDYRCEFERHEMPDLFNSN